MSRSIANYSQDQHVQMTLEEVAGNRWVTHGDPMILRFSAILVAAFSSKTLLFTLRHECIHLADKARGLIKVEKVVALVDSYKACVGQIGVEAAHRGVEFLRCQRNIRRSHVEDSHRDGDPGKLGLEVGDNQLMEGVGDGSLVAVA